MASLLLQLGVSAAMAALTIFCHLLGLNGLARMTRYQIDRLRSPWLRVDRLIIPLALSFCLFTLHAVEVGCFAILFHAVKATSGWEEAIYFSTSAYSAADVTSLDFSRAWRVTGALESLNGVLLIGWSTAFLFTNLGRILHTEETHPLPAGAIAALSPRPSGSRSSAPSGVNSSDTELMQ